MQWERANDENVLERSKTRRGQRLSKSIYNLVLAGDKFNMERTKSNFITDEVKINFDVLGLCVKNWIHREVSSTNVITPKCWWIRKINLKFLEKRLQPSQLNGSIGKGTVLGLNTRTRHRRLFLRTLRN